jgi:F0F1-type ATP synthase membrane subunit b/b'
MENEVLELIEMLYTMVSEAWGVPLGNDKCIIERDKALNLLDELKAQLPAELAEAKRLVSARDEFISNAKREADAIRRSAEDQARRLVEEQEIVRIAKSRSNELVSTAENKSRELRRVANEYVDDALRRTEEAVSAALDEVRQSRVRFRSAAGARSVQQTIQTLSDEDLESDVN